MPQLRNVRHERFCQAVVFETHGNGAAAVPLAGYKSERADQAAYQLMQRTEIKERIAELRDEFWRSVQMSREETIARITRVARFDPRKLYDADGQLKSIADLDDETAGAVASVEVDEIGKEGETIGLTKKIKASDRNKALEMMGKIHGVFERDNEQQNAGARRLADMLADVAASGGHKSLVKKR